MAEDKESRTEPATARRRTETRGRGQVARSMEIGKTAVLIISLIVLYATGASLSAALRRVITDSVQMIGRPDLTPASTLGLFRHLATLLAGPVMPLIVAVVVVALFAGFSQVGFHLTAEPMKPDPNRINPVRGAGRLFSLRSMVTLLISLAKVAAICAIGFITIRGCVPQFLALGRVSPEGILHTVSQATMTLGLRTAVLLAVIAVIDFFYQRWQHERDLRMTRQEVKDDHKLTEGDPGIKSRIRRVQAMMSRRRMLADVPDADVVVRNPTHFAVALKYDPGKSSAPLVLAKGADHMAERILKIAREHDVPIVHDMPLARALYKTVEVGAQIPPKLYRAVARMLAQIYATARHLSRTAHAGPVGGPIR